MTISVATPVAAPNRSVERFGPRARRTARAVLISSCCCVTGALAFVATYGLALEENEPEPAASIIALMVLDLLVGLVAGIASGPVRGSRSGNLLLVVAGSLSAWSVPASMVAMVRIGGRRSPAWDGAVVAIMVAGTFAVAWVHPLSSGEPLTWRLIGAVAVAAVAIAALMWGRARGTRAALITSLRHQAAAAERAREATRREREADIARARAQERSAIARDMHDSLSHQLSLISVHAGALAHRNDLPPMRIREAARTIHTCAGEANAVLREVLSTLRYASHPGSEERERVTDPLPVATTIDALANQARTTGQKVAVSWRGTTPHALQEQSPTTGTSLVRICSELITNARKHAPGAALALRLELTGTELVLRALNPALGSQPHTLGTGFGLVGVAERARLVGGTARWGHTRHDQFEVEVRIPWHT
ncbi:hypothetical protein IM660_05180 [Ruania alkalisoli]|uniref:histidine kinase n=1 Tax=Ruania alkalisoli TaxID=2779775 RepID=A0A7M1SYG0_9MICO|nr:histidine kinase [Ruania alkalisoli]QOR71673.1 hypothetical protein IM660_05180 [Ruania alkalisoli]